MSPTLRIYGYDAKGQAVADEVPIGGRTVTTRKSFKSVGPPDEAHVAAGLISAEALADLRRQWAEDDAARAAAQEAEDRAAAIPLTPKHHAMLAAAQRLRDVTPALTEWEWPTDWRMTPLGGLLGTTSAGWVQIYVTEETVEFGAGFSEPQAWPMPPIEAP